MRQITGMNLWLGHVGDARDVQKVHAAGIEALVDLAGNEPPLVATRDLVYWRYPILDGSGNPTWLLAAAIDGVSFLLRHKIPVLVFCSTGMSRSIVIASAAHAKVRGSSLQESLAELAGTGPADISTALLKDVLGIMQV